MASALTPAALLFRAHNDGASGRLDLRGPDATVWVRGGRVVATEGVTGLIEGGSGALSADLGAAMAKGMPLDRAFEAAGEGLGRFLARGIASGASARWTEGAEAPDDAFPLEVPIPRLVARGLQLERPPALVSAALEPLLDASITVLRTDPGAVDGPTLRTLASCRGGRTLREVIAAANAAGPGRADQAWIHLDLLIQLGFVSLEGPVERPAPPRGPPPPPRRPEPPRAPPKAAEPPPPPEPTPAEKVEELQREAARLAKANPLEVFGLSPADARDPRFENKLGTGYRVAAARFHPDRYVNEPPEVKNAAGACFNVISELNAQVLDPYKRRTWAERLDAQLRGEPWVDPVDREKAKFYFRQAQKLEASRQWTQARENLQTAMGLDPIEGLYAVSERYLAAVLKELPYAKAAQAIEGIKQRSKDGNAHASFLAGRLYRLGGQNPDAIRCYKACLAIKPDHVDAQRELRLISKETG